MFPAYVVIPGPDYRHLAKFRAKVCTARPQLRELVFSSDFDNLWKLKQFWQPGNASCAPRYGVFERPLHRRSCRCCEVVRHGTV